MIDQLMNWKYQKEDPLSDIETVSEERERDGRQTLFLMDGWTSRGEEENDEKKLSKKVTFVTFFFGQNRVKIEKMHFVGGVY